MPIDYSRYPKDWKTKIVPKILERAGNKCEICGLENKQIIYSVRIYLRVKGSGKYGYRNIWFRNRQDALKTKPLGTIKTVKVILTTAHLDHDEENQNVTDDRLMAMCQKCHLDYDAEEKYNRILRKSGNKDE